MRKCVVKNSCAKNTAPLQPRVRQKDEIAKPDFAKFSKKVTTNLPASITRERNHLAKYRLHHWTLRSLRFAGW